MGYRSVFGLDVHARSITAAALDVTTGEIITKRFPYDPTALAEWILSFPGPIKAVYESGVTGFHLCRTLRELGITCVVGAVSKMFRPPADTKRKNDKRDSEFLVRMLAANNIVEVYVPDEECEGMRNLFRAYTDAKARLKAATSRLSQFLIRHGIVWNEKTPTANLKKAWGTKAYEVWLNTMRFESAADQDTFDRYIADANVADASVKDLEALIGRYAQSPRYKPLIDALCALKGINVLTAFAFAVEVDDFMRFKAPSKFASWLGLTTSEYSSGARKVSGGITKAGNTHLRRLLVECSWSYARSGSGRKQLKEGQVVSEEIAAEAHKASLRLRKRRKHLAGTGKNSCIVNAAVARELACWIWQIAFIVQSSAKKADVQAA